MFLNIGLVVIGIAIPLCNAKCESYYFMMEKYFDGFQESYRPINKDNNTWSITNIHSNNETQKFDMNCVLNLHCNSITHLISHIPIGPRFGHDDTYKYTNIDFIDKSKSSSLPPENTNETKIIPTEEYSIDTTTVSNIDNDAGLSSGTTSNSETGLKNNSVTETNPKISSSSVEDSQINNDNNSSLSDISSETSTESTITENSVTTETITSPKNGKEDESGENSKESTSIVNQDLHTSKENTAETTDKIEVFPQNTTKLETVDPNITKSIEVNTKDNITLAGNANSNETAINGMGYHKYNPEESKTLASKVLAGMLGAVAAVAVCLLVKVGVTKLIAHLTQVGVYRLPDP